MQKSFFVKYTKEIILLGSLLSVLFGLGTYTVYYARGLSYLSNNPESCVNCHIMRPQYEGWQKSSHHAVATCNDCHAPHDLIRKYLTKGENGFRHSLAFTLQNFHEPIMIRPKNAKVLNEACLSCHQGLVDNILAHKGTPIEVNTCTRCHATVGHGVK